MCTKKTECNINTITSQFKSFFICRIFKFFIRHKDEPTGNDFLWGAKWALISSTVQDKLKGERTTRPQATGLKNVILHIGRKVSCTNLWAEKTCLYQIKLQYSKTLSLLAAVHVGFGVKRAYLQATGSFKGTLWNLGKYIYLPLN